MISGTPTNFFSSDGITWSKVFSALNMEHLTWCDSSLQYVGVKGGGGWFDAPRIITSVDGQNWYDHVVRNPGGNLNAYYGFSSIAYHGERSQVAR